ncbi:hypothetical protein SBRCBS47491_004415 [Sporothrix bragantina]|uniref:Major facilitator superfamily (MFS) profile domain-containing protein n=1 Tax=Sporothrix bragantina TaxID=671064 RepID=A0ABP0BN80_9PEZI
MADKDTKPEQAVQQVVQQIPECPLPSPPSSPSPSSSPPALPPLPPARPFSAFSDRQRWCIVFLASLAAVFGPISSNIYVPAIPQITEAFHESTQRVDLTLTVYLVVQATAPSVFAGLSDALGRRPILLGCLCIYTGACIGIALTPSSSFWLLLLLRAIQAMGGSPAIGTGAGTIGDIATPGERGRFMGLFQGVALVGPALGPVLGGILVQYRSWRWIFWVLAIWCAVDIVCIFLFMPETLRAIVGDGSIAPPWILSRPFQRRKNKHLQHLDTEQQALQSRPEKKKYRPLASLQMLVYPEILAVLAFGSCAFACMFASLTVFSSVLTDPDHYGYNDVTVGLCYLCQGFGSLLVGVLGGRVHDWYFARLQARLHFTPKHARDLDGFPIERCRLRFVPYYLPVYLAAVVGYGWALDKTASIAVPLVLSLLIGMGAQFSSQACSLLLVDMFPSNAGASSAAYNMIRCSLSAVVTAVVTPLTNAIGLGWTFTIFAGVLLAAYPFLVLLQIKGPAWRKKRAAAWS